MLPNKESTQLSPPGLLTGNQSTRVETTTPRVTFKPPLIKGKAKPKQPLSDSQAPPYSHNPAPPPQECTRAQSTTISELQLQRDKKSEEGVEESKRYEPSPRPLPSQNPNHHRKQPAARPLETRPTLPSLRLLYSNKRDIDYPIFMRIDKVASIRDNLQQIQGDGNCLFSAIAAGLKQFDIHITSNDLRLKIADAIRDVPGDIIGTRDQYDRLSWDENRDFRAFEEKLQLPHRILKKHKLTRDDIFRYNNTPHSVWGGTLHQEAFHFLYKEQNIRIETWSPLLRDTRIALPSLQETPDSPTQNNIWKRNGSPNHLDAATRYIHLTHTQYGSKSWASTDIARIPLETETILT